MSNSFLKIHTFKGVWVYLRRYSNPCGNLFVKYIFFYGGQLQIKNLGRKSADPCHAILIKNTLREFYLYNIVDVKRLLSTRPLPKCSLFWFTAHNQSSKIISKCCFDTCASFMNNSRGIRGRIWQSFCEFASSIEIFSDSALSWYKKWVTINSELSMDKRCPGQNYNSFSSVPPIRAS